MSEFKLSTTVEVVTTVAIEYGTRGPIVTSDGDGQRWEIVRVERTVDISDDSDWSDTKVYGRKVRRDGERTSGGTDYPVYGDEVDAVAAAWLGDAQ